jgi:hypothetical protein
VPNQRRHLAPDFGVGRRIRILDIFRICLRFESTARLEIGHNLPVLEGRSSVPIHMSVLMRAVRCVVGGSGDQVDFFGQFFDPVYLEEHIGEVVAGNVVILE